MSDFDYEKYGPAAQGENGEKSKESSRRRRRRKRKSTGAKAGSLKKITDEFMHPRSTAQLGQEKVARLDISKPGIKEFLTSNANKYFGILGLGLVMVAIFIVYQEVKKHLDEDSGETVAQVVDSRQIEQNLAREGDGGKKLVENEEPVRNGRVLFSIELEGKAKAIEKATLAMDASRMRLFDEANTLIKEARELDPDLFGLHAVQANILIDQKRWNTAEGALIESIEKKEFVALSYFRLAQVYRNKKRYEDAFQAAMSASQRAPDNEFILIMISDLHRFLGNYKDGYFWAKRAYDLVPNDKTFAVKYHLTCLKLDKFDAKAYGLEYRLEYTNDPHDADLILAAADALEIGNKTKAIKYLKRLQDRVSQDTFDQYMTDPYFEQLDFQ